MEIKKIWERFDKGALNDLVNRKQEELQTYIDENAEEIQDIFWQSMMNLGSALEHPSFSQVQYSFLNHRLIQNQGALFLVEATDKRGRVLNSSEYHIQWYCDIWHSLHAELESEIKKYVKTALYFRLEQVMIVLSQRYLHCIEDVLRKRIRQEALEGKYPFLLKEEMKITLGGYRQKQDLLFYYED